jgi:Tfp pilus assembly protein PilZ
MQSGQMHSRDTVPKPDEQPDRRREPRFSIGAQAVLRMQGDSKTYAAVTLNVSTGGLLLKVTESNPFTVGDNVECEIALPDAPQEAFASWGVGRVVRIDESGAAVELRSGIFTAADEL